MPKRSILYIALGIALFTALLIYLLGDNVGSSPDQQKKITKNAAVFDNWEESYLLDETNATGVSLFNELLEYKTKKTSVLIETKLEEEDLKDSNTTYIFIGNQFQLKTEEFDSILAQVKKGANLFLAYKNISGNIFDYFFKESGFMWDYSEQVIVHLPDTSYKMNAVFQNDTISIPWNFYNFDAVKLEEFGEVESIKSLSDILGYSNFLDLKMGKGHVYLHSNPELFQNYQLLSESGYGYSEFVVDQIPAKHKIRWLELGRFINDGSDMYGTDEESTGEEDNSYLQFIFNNTALTIALLITLLGIILFLVFRTKRSQPIIPYIAPTQNQSLVFAETIKEIYYKQQTPFSLLQVMKKNFNTAVNKQFFIDISKDEREKSVKSLAEKTGIKVEKLDDLLRKLNNKQAVLVDYAYLEDVSQLQQNFYRETGIIKQRLLDKVEARAKIYQRKILLPLLLIVIGIASVLYGFYLLHIAEGIGIALWPIGILLSAFGIRLYSLPLLKAEAKKITFYPIFGVKKEVNKEDITHVYNENNSTVFSCSDNSKYRVNHGELSIYDRNAYEQFIFQFLK